MTNLFVLITALRFRGAVFYFKMTDNNTKKELDEMCAEMGMNLTTFFMIYAKKALRERKIPFMVDAPLKIDENDNYDD